MVKSFSPRLINDADRSLNFADKRAEGSLPDFLNDDPNGYVMIQVGNGYGGIEIDVNTTPDRLNPGQIPGYRIYLRHSRYVFDVPHESQCPHLLNEAIKRK